MPRLIPAVVLAAIFISSCTSTTKETSYSDVQADSIAKAKLDSVNQMLRHRNDSLINVAAILEAKRLDSLDQTKAAPAKITPVIPDKLPKRAYENEPRLPLPPEKKDTAK